MVIIFMLQIGGRNFRAQYCCQHGSFLLNEIIKTSMEIRTWLINYIHVNPWDVITHPSPKFNGGLVNRHWSKAIYEVLHPISYNKCNYLSMP